MDNKENVLKIISLEGEQIKLRHCNLRGEEIEEWLKVIEDAIKQQLQHLIQKCLADYEKEETSVSQWVTNHAS